jgi:hypothetical protein
MQDARFLTKRSSYGYQCDVRATYAHLPFQAFWTWLTGKDICRLEPRRPFDTLLSERQLWLQLTWSWFLIIISVVVGVADWDARGISWAAKAVVTVLCWLLIVNRTRGLLHTFHYTNHGASISNMARARWMGKYFMSIPIMHTSWDRYHRIHAQDHHSTATLCSSADPDEVFMSENGFRLGMPEREFWTRLVLAPFHPLAIWRHISFRLKENFLTCGWREILPRALFWTAFIVVAYASGYGLEIAIIYLFPLFILTQLSSWLQHTTEHLWFSEPPGDVSTFVYYGSVTWGRFLGRPHPGQQTGFAHRVRLARWWASVIVLDLPIRLFAFMQDLPSHDYHHRSPRVNFWSIARERAANEGRPSKFGPMAETWGLPESWMIIRDHLCRGRHDPFLLLAWDRAENARRDLPALAAD